MRIRAVVFGMVLAMMAGGIRASEGEAVRGEGMEEHVSVTATRLPADEEDLSEAPVPVTIYTREMIEASKAATLQEFLAADPSIDVYDQIGNTVQSTVALRGFNTATTLALVVDGVRVNEPDDNRAAFDLIPLEDVDRIEVIRGSYSSVYGGGALGGVINVTTRSGAGASPLAARLAAGSYGANQQGVSTGSAHGEISYFVGASRSAADGYRDSTDFESLALLGKLRWEFSERQRLDFSVRGTENDMGAGGALDATEMQQDRRQNVFNHPDFEESSMRMVTAGYQAELGAGFSLRTVLSQRSNDVEILTTGRAAAQFGSGFLTETSYDTTALVAQAGHVAAGERVSASTAFGLELRNSDFTSDASFTDPQGNDPTASTTNTTDERILGAFLEETLSFGPKWSVTGGVRYDDVRLDFVQEDAFTGTSSGRTRFTEWSPRLGFNFNPTESTGIYASASTAFLAPTINQLFAFADFGSNPSLEPQTSVDLEVGLRQGFGTRAWLDVNLFRIDVDDEIRFVFTDLSAFRGENRNVGNTRRQGFELAAGGVLGPWARARFGYTWIDATYREDAFLDIDQSFVAAPAGTRLTMVPEHKLVATFEFDLAPRWTLYVRDLWVSEQPLDGDETGASEPLPSYNVLDVWVRFQARRWDVFLKIRNLLDEEYSTRGIAGMTSYFTPAPERSLQAGLTFHL